MGMKRPTKSETNKTLEKFEAAVSRTEEQWLAAWAEGLPMPRNYRLPNPFPRGALKG
jgi:hypothetical protein